MAKPQKAKAPDKKTAQKRTSTPRAIKNREKNEAQHQANKERMAMYREGGIDITPANGPLSKSVRKARRESDRRALGHSIDSIAELLK